MYAAGIRWVLKKVISEPMRFSVIVAGSLVAKQYLEDQNILPSLIP